MSRRHLINSSDVFVIKDFTVVQSGVAPEPFKSDSESRRSSTITLLCITLVRKYTISSDSVAAKKLLGNFQLSQSVHII